jgi:16S rRNA (guanine527-N7)-methyltransferase
VKQAAPFVISGFPTASVRTVAPVPGPETTVLLPTHRPRVVAVILGSRTENAASIAACAVSSRPGPVMVDRRFHVKRRTEQRMGSVSDTVAADDGAVPPRDNTAESANAVFGAHLPLAERYVRLLTEHGVPRGLIGPREVDRLWDRHVLNSAVLSELIPADATVVDVGSGAGLPGIPLAIARPDLRVTLLEPMARRVAWLTEVAEDLDIDIRIERGRAEEPDVRRRIGQADVVTARAVAPLAKLAGWCLPLVRPGGWLMALKGESASEELARDADQVRRAGGTEQAVVVCGADVLPVPTTIVMVRKSAAAEGRDGRPRTRKDR